VIPIAVPPLRERLEDIPALVQHFTAQFSRDNNRRPARFSPAALEALAQARWRGNIRELRNSVERLLIMVDRDVVEGEDVRAVVRPERQGAAAAAPATPVQAAPGAARPATLREFKEVSEREFLVEKLREFGWNISRTADVIDTPRSNLYKKLEQYGITQETDG
jgi:two-component system nitrogen regulation response regulator NtrX